MSWGQSPHCVPSCPYSCVPLLSVLLGASWPLPLPPPCLAPQFIDELRESLPVLKAELQELQAQRQEAREVVFKDILLRRPKYVMFLQLAS